MINNSTNAGPCATACHARLRHPDKVRSSGKALIR